MDYRPARRNFLHNRKFVRKNGNYTPTRRKGRNKVAMDLMVDIETLGTELDSVVQSVGLVMFEPTSGKIGETLHIKFDIKDQVKNHKRVIYPSTLLWWLGQNIDTFKKSLDGKAKFIWGVVKIITFIQVQKPVRLWGNSASFDLGILAHMIKSSSLELPWMFWQECCYRTIKATHNDLVPTTISNPDAHDALSDAVFQAKRLSEIMMYILNIGEHGKTKKRK